MEYRRGATGVFVSIGSHSLQASELAEKKCQTLLKMIRHIGINQTILSDSSPYSGKNHSSSCPRSISGGSSEVLIDGKPSARLGDAIVEALSPLHHWI
jgi:uncharacterized protein YbbK (DUF523 family)